MFNVCTVEDKLRVKPSELGKATVEAVTAEIQRTYIDKVLPKLGLVITLFDILSISEGFVFPSDGGVHFDTKFRLVVFKPFVGQVLLGQLKSCNNKGLKVDLGFFDDLFVPEHNFPAEYWFHSQDGLWVWKYEGNDIYLDLKETIRVRVMEVRFNPVPTEVERQGDESDTIPRGTEGNPFTPMEVIASVNDDDIPGLGLTSWWEGVEEEGLEEDAVKEEAQ
ncbi:hypothetical protein ABBQ32_005698 [Trebouxia sp. C0010 RCD-2024]